MQRKWYENKTLLAILILFVYPIGVIGIWLRNTETPKKILYSILGFMAWCFVFPVTLVIILAIFTSSDNSRYDYEAGNNSMALGDYTQAITYYNYDMLILRYF